MHVRHWFIGPDAGLRLQLAAGAFARLGDPAHAAHAMPQPPRGLG
jgi:hypothetical protein